MNTTKTYYRSEGSVRGACAHKHQNLAQAIECTRKDQAACRAQGGGAYSDRTEVKYVDSAERNIPQAEYDAALADD